MSFNLILAIIALSAIDGVLASSKFLLECRIPDDSRASLESALNVNLTQEEREQLEIEGRCFLACATETYIVT